MMPDQCNAWMALPAEHRQQAVAIRDERLVGFIQTHMRSFCQLDLHTSSHAFVGVRYPPLLATQYTDASADTAAAPASATAVPLTARAAKRLRQRERRKLAKRGFRGAPGTLAELSKPCDVSEKEKRRPLDEDVSSEASASTAVGSRHTQSWVHCSQREAEEEGSIEDSWSTIDTLSSFTPSSDLLPPLS